MQGRRVARRPGRARGADPLYERGGDGDIEALLAPALDEIARADLRVITGDVVLDEATFLEPGPAPEWPSKDQWWAEFCALSGGFSANRGCVTVHVTPARIGEAASVSAFPREHGLLENFGVRTQTGVSVVVHSRRSRPDCWSAARSARRARRSAIRARRRIRSPCSATRCAEPSRGVEC